MLTITTYDWVPDMPRGYVRDIRARWACEEAGLAYDIDTVPLVPKSDDHFAHQPFGQVPILKDDGVELFESGAIVLHLAEKSDALMPTDAQGRAETVQWVLAALNSIEMWVMPWQMAKIFRPDPKAEAEALKMMTERLGQLETVLAGRDHLAGGRFTVADLMMTEVLRVVRDMGGLDDFPETVAFIGRMTDRPAFKKAHADQVAHFAASTPPPGAEKLTGPREVKEAEKTGTEKGGAAKGGPANDEAAE